ncbi:MAG: NAD(P)/FAD-dependent oxidoreductase, partial [Lachnospiraceae bacterium]|nr:NAD(P)/FAD-dependent oxidoreductase [Lachnospiraceae bacterium]
MKKANRVLVIGAGASGLMAAYAASSSGASVTVLERNEKAGKKIYITGKGRCNLTNNCDEQEFLKNVVTNPRFLYSAINAFTTSDMMGLMEEL